MSIVGDGSFEVDLLQAVHSVHLSNVHAVKLVDGLEGFPAFQLNGLTNLAFPHVLYFPQMRMQDRFALIATFQVGFSIWIVPAFFTAAKYSTTLIILSEL